MSYYIQTRLNVFSRFFLIFLLLGLSACGSVSILDDPKKAEDNYRLQNQQVEKARALAEQGDYVAAAQAFWQFSAGIEPPHQQNYQLTSVEYLIKANLIDQAAERLALIKPLPNDPVSWQRIDLAQIEMQIAKQQSQPALDALAKLNAQALNEVLQKRYHELYALAHETLGQYQQAADRRIGIDAALANTNRQLYNQKMVWNDLLHMSPMQLGQPVGNRSQASQAWYALALLAKTVSNTHYPKALSQWQQRYPQHPIRAEIFQQLNQPANQQGAMIQRANPNANAHIALLLPQSGNLRQTSQAISDAFIAAWSQNRRMPPPVRYDVSDTNTVASIYEKAVNSGAVVVVGPLLKNTLTALSQTYQHFPVPTLFLNQLELLSQTYSNLFQFSLSPEEEAAQVAQQALLDGKHMATVLVPDNSWGQRLAQAFRQSWESHGGTFLGQAYYTERDVSTPTQQVLLNHPDTDMLFIAASPEDARLLVPQVRYVLSSPQMLALHKLNLPIYATSHVYAGQFDAMDKDLSGVKFVDIPWLFNGLDERYQAFKSQQETYVQTGNSRLFAFGLDAYQIADYLYQSGNSPQNMNINGATGQLSLDLQGVVHRQLKMIQFDAQGRAEPL